MTSRNLSIASNHVTTTYAYKDSDNFSGFTTRQLLAENIDGLEYTYGYDFTDNITSIIRTQNGTGKVINYFYDKNNQLIRENNQISNKTIVYSYDSGGNITSVKEYPYTAGDVTNVTVTNSHSYSYGNSKWKDQLTSYDGQSIVYDSIGNPTTYLGATLVWDGRDLISYTKDNKKICYTYNAGGVSVAKL